MSSFRTLGRSVHTTDEGYAVHPILDIELGPPVGGGVATYVVLGPDFAVLHSGERDDCIVAADEFEQAGEPGLP